MSKENLKNKIDSDINTNGLQQITGAKLNDVLNDIVDEMALGGGVIEEGNTQAVSGGEVYEKFNPILKNFTKIHQPTKRNWQVSGSSGGTQNGGTYHVYETNGGYLTIKRPSVQGARFRIQTFSSSPVLGSVGTTIFDDPSNTVLAHSFTLPEGKIWIGVYLNNSTFIESIESELISIGEVNGVVEEDNLFPVNGDEVFKKAIEPINILNSVVNIFNTDNILNLALNSSNVLSNNVNGRVYYTECNEGDVFIFKRKTTTQNNRLRPGFTSQYPSNRVQVYNITNNDSQLEFTITTPSDAKYLVIYLSLDTVEPDYSEMLLFKKSNNRSSNIDDNLRYDINNYFPEFDNNIFSNDILKNAYVSVNDRVTESATAGSILLNNLNRGDRYYINLIGSGANKSVIAFSGTTDEVVANKLMDYQYNTGGQEFIVEIKGFEKQAYIYISDNVSSLDLNKIIVKKLESTRIEINEHRTINGVLNYFQADVTDPVTSGSSFVLRYSNINDIYSKFDELMTLNPNIISKRLLGYGSMEIDPDAVINTEDTNLPIYEYTFSYMRENESPNTLNPLNYKFKKRPKVFLLCGVHGDEKSTTWASYLLFKRMLENMDSSNLIAKFKNQLEFVVIPIANPSGFNAHRRFLENGKDLNRIFSQELKTDGTYEKYPEVRAFLNSLEQNIDSYIFIDYHCFERGNREFVSYVNTENELSLEAYSQLAYEMNDRLLDIYELPSTDVLQTFFSKTKGNLIEKYVILNTPIRYTAIVETLENFGGVFYTQANIQAAEEILYNYIRSVFLR